MPETILLDKIAKLLVDNDSSMKYNFMNLSARKLLDIYNAHELFHKGHRENVNCAPCINRVIAYFKGLLDGITFEESQLTESTG